MFHYRLIGLLTALFACTAATAQKVGLPAPDVKVQLTGTNQNQENRPDEELLIGDLKGRIAILYFMRINDPGSLEAAPKVVELYKQLRAQGVLLLVMSPEAKDKVEQKLKEYEAYRWVYGPVLGDIYEVVSFPYCFIIDPHGVVAWKGHPHDKLEQRVKDQIARTPPIGADKAALEDRLERALALQNKGEIGRAYTLTKRVIDVTSDGDSLNERAKGQLEKIREATKKWLDEAREAQRSKDWKKAVKIAADVSVRLQTDKKDAPEIELVADADTEIGKLRGDVDTKELIAKGVENARAEMRNDEAAELEITKDYALALRIYRAVFDDFPKTAGGEAAKAAIDRILGDPKIMAKIKSDRANTQADRWLSIAERYQRVRMYADARAQLEKLLKEHPRTPAAAKAREMLKALPADDGKTAAKKSETDKKD